MVFFFFGIKGQVHPGCTVQGISQNLRQVFLHEIPVFDPSYFLSTLYEEPENPVLYAGSPMGLLQGIEQVCLSKAVSLAARRVETELGSGNPYMKILCKLENAVHA